MKDQHMHLAANAFEKLINECESESEISELSSFMAMLCIKVIHGVEGQQFKADFLNAAIDDNEMIKPARASVQ